MNDHYENAYRMFVKVVVRFAKEVESHLRASLFLAAHRPVRCLPRLLVLGAVTGAISFSGCSFPQKKRESFQPATRTQVLEVKTDLIAKNLKRQGTANAQTEVGQARPGLRGSQVQLASHHPKRMGGDLLTLDQAFPAVATELDLVETDNGLLGLHEISLEEMLQIAELNNPTLRQANAAICEAQAIRLQVGLRPNPTIGYQAVQVADVGTDQHTLFIERDFVTANKLACNRQVASKAVQVQVMELETQRQRVRTDVSVKFMEALAAQQRVELIADFVEVADAGLKLAELRKNALEGTQVEVLQADIQKNEVELKLTQAEVRFDALLRELSALCGVRLSEKRLAGSLPTAGDSLPWEEVSESILAQTPEHQVALSALDHAKAILHRSNIQSVPNVSLQLATGFDNGTDNGMINVELASPLPTNNKNQGNISAARAAMVAANAELKRVRDSIYSRVAAVSKEYDASQAAVQRYREVILPKSKESLELAEQAYRIGESSFLVVLTARRTYFEANLQFLEAQRDLARSQAQIDGLVLTGGLDRAAKLPLNADLRDDTFFQQ